MDPRDCLELKTNKQDEIKVWYFGDHGGLESRILPKYTKVAVVHETYDWSVSDLVPSPVRFTFELKIYYFNESRNRYYIGASRLGEARAVQNELIRINKN